MNPLQHRIYNVFRCRVAFVVKICDMRTSRSAVNCHTPGKLDHGASSDADRPDIKRIQICLMTADLRIFYLYTAVLDAGNIRGSSANLEEYPVRQLFIHQRTGHTRGRAGENREDRALAHLIHRHYTAVAPHHHEGRLDLRLPDGFLCHIGCLEHLRKNTSVNHSRACAHFKAIQL